MKYFRYFYSCGDIRMQERMQEHWWSCVVFVENTQKTRGTCVENIFALIYTHFTFLFVTFTPLDRMNDIYILFLSSPGGVLGWVVVRWLKSESRTRFFVGLYFPIVAIRTRPRCCEFDLTILLSSCCLLYCTRLALHAFKCSVRLVTVATLLVAYC